jgi:hypothetical protein
MLYLPADMLVLLYLAYLQIWRGLEKQRCLWDILVPKVRSCRYYILVPSSYIEASADSSPLGLLPLDATPEVNYSSSIVAYSLQQQCDYRSAKSRAEQWALATAYVQQRQHTLTYAAACNATIEVQKEEQTSGLWQQHTYSTCQHTLTYAAAWSFSFTSTKVQQWVQQWVCVFFFFIVSVNNHGKKPQWVLSRELE